MKILWKKLRENIDKFDTCGKDKYSCLNNKQQFDQGKNSPDCKHQIEPDKKLKTLYIVIFVWAFTIGFYIVLFSGFSQVVAKVEDKINLKEDSSFSVYKPGIDIVNSLQNSGYLKYIHRLYIHPQEENKMMIMIKPNYWGIIDQDEKNRIKTEVLEKWKKLYKNSDPEKPLTPEVYFANT